MFLVIVFLSVMFGVIVIGVWFVEIDQEMFFSVYEVWFEYVLLIFLG